MLFIFLGGWDCFAHPHNRWMFGGTSSNQDVMHYKSTKEYLHVDRLSPTYSYGEVRQKFDFSAAYEAAMTY